MIIATEASERHSQLKNPSTTTKGILGGNWKHSRKRDSHTNAKSTARIYSQKLKEWIMQKAANTPKYHPLLQNSMIGTLLKW